MKSRQPKLTSSQGLPSYWSFMRGRPWQDPGYLPPPVRPKAARPTLQDGGGGSSVGRKMRPLLPVLVRNLCFSSRVGVGMCRGSGRVI